MKVHKWEDIRHKGMSRRRIEENDRAVERELIEMDLRELREALGKTQVEVAKAAEIAQSELSRAERRSDHRVSTLRRVIEALGGELELVAHVGGKRIRLHA